MASGSDVQNTSAVPESVVRAQLERILASELFSRSERLSTFLRFVVEQTLSGQSAILKEQVLAHELYNKGADFDSAADAVVRVDARRLRDKLREFYADNPGEPLRIGLPKGGYVPVFELVAEEPAAIEGQPPETGYRLRWISAFVAVIVVALAAVWLISPRPRHRPQLRPLTSNPGVETQVSMSPDGSAVAYACSAAGQSARRDICIKEIGSETIQHLTNTPVAEHWPAWSPDGRQIAFGRSAPTSAPGYQDFGQEIGIFTVSRFGGPERKISDTGGISGWTADGKSLLIRDREKREDPYGIFQVDLETLRRRRITQPLSGDGDWRFDVSPDGKMLAFIRFAQTGIGDLFTVSMQGGEPHRLTDLNRFIGGVAWMPNGKEILYSSDSRMWRISATLSTPGRGEPVPDIPMPVLGLSISRPGAGQAARIAFRTSRTQLGLRRVDLSSADENGTFGAIESFAPATRQDIPGNFSPDGSSVAFVSNRNTSGFALWIAEVDGGHLRQVTSLGSATRMLAGTWSADGKRILLNATLGDQNNLYIVPVGGREPERLIGNTALEGVADWSRDGQWIYYAATSTGGLSDIWRIPADGGQQQRITFKGGFEPRISPDGQFTYYVDGPPSAGSARLMRIAAEGGEASLVIENVKPLLWSLTDKGIYYLQEEGTNHAIHFYSFENAKVRRIGVLPFRAARLQFPGRFTVSHDGRWALINVQERSEGDLMLLDDFR